MKDRFSHSRLGNISFIAFVTISYFVPRLLRSLVTKYDIVPRAIKLTSPVAPHAITYTYNMNSRVVLNTQIRTEGEFYI